MHKWILILLTYLAELVCGNENGRCEDMCSNVDGIISCTCTNINETLAPPDDRICLCKLTILILVLPTSILFAIHTLFCIAELLYFTLYDEVYENASTFIHHPLYHPDEFQLSCYSETVFDSPRRWIFSANDNSLMANITVPGSTVLNVEIDGIIVPITFQASNIITVEGELLSVGTLQVSHVISGNFVCQSNDFSLALRVVTGMH